MRRLKNLLRRRSYDEDDLVTTNTNANRARPSRVGRSVEFPRDHTHSGDTKPITGLTNSKHNESMAKHDYDASNLLTANPHPAKRTQLGITERAKSRPLSARESDEPKHHALRHPRKEAPRDLRGNITNQTAKKPGASPRIVPDESRSNPSLPSTKLDVLENDYITKQVEELNDDGVETCSFRTAKESVSDVIHTEDTDETILHPPVVTHENIYPHVHEIVEEQIYREIHNHDVYHRIQPVYDVELLPARHFVPGPVGGLVEVSQESLPECTGPNQQWHLSKNLSQPMPSSPTGQPDFSYQH